MNTIQNDSNSKLVVDSKLIYNHVDKMEKLIFFTQSNVCNATQFLLPFSDIIHSNMWLHIIPPFDPMIQLHIQLHVVNLQN